MAAYLNNAFPDVKAANQIVWDNGNGSGYNTAYRNIETIRQIKVVMNGLEINAETAVLSPCGTVDMLTVASWLGMGNSTFKTARQKVRHLWSAYQYLKSYPTQLSTTIRSGAYFSDQALRDVLDQLFVAMLIPGDPPATQARFSQQWHPLLIAIDEYRAHVSVSFGTPILTVPGDWVI